MITIHNVSKTFRGSKTDVVALKNINLTINRGDIFGIIGTSGAGKSTLLRCLSALESPTQGEITIDGISTNHITPTKLTNLRKNMGVVFQGYNLLMQKTVAENIAFPLTLLKTQKDTVHQLVSELLELVDLSDKADSYPAQLSGGQKQRVAIARALATSPSVILCDEPTSALDPLTTRHILKTLKHISVTLGVTIVIITHEINVVRSICNQVAVIEGGCIVETGTTAAVFQHPQQEMTKLLLDWQGD